MARSPHFIDPAAEARNLAIVTRTREVTRESVAILQQTSSRPDTFLGRKTQEPFPQASEKADQLATSAPLTICAPDADSAA